MNISSNTNAALPKMRQTGSEVCLSSFDAQIDGDESYVGNRHSAEQLVIANIAGRRQ
jgi:hypothetical protein